MLLPYLLNVSIFSTVLPTPQESFSVGALSRRMLPSARESSNTTHPPVANTGTSQKRRDYFAVSLSSTLTALEEFPMLEAVSSQTAITKTTCDTTTSVWTSKDTSGASFSEVLSAAKPTIVPSQIAEVEAASKTQKSTAHIPRNASSSTFPTRPEVPTQMIGTGVNSTERIPTNNFENTRPSSTVTHSNASGRSTPVPSLDNSTTETSKMLQSGGLTSKKTIAEQPPYSLNDSRKIPDNVFVVCDDFLQKHLKRPASIYEKTKACKGCENRSKLKYAFWNDNSKEWQVIRSYPIEKVPANVAFSVCRQYAVNSCLRTTCSFPHGQEELLMWTMEREGGKFSKFPARH